MRRSGILLPISSLPSPYGIGTIGRTAFQFVDFLAAAGQTLWQILPLGPTGFGDSPYQSFSTFAGNPSLIDLDNLVELGLLTKDEIESFAWGGLPISIDYGLIFANRAPVLRLATSRLDPQSGSFRQFEAESAHWLDDYAFFMAIKNSLDMTALAQWPLPLRRRDQKELHQARQQLEEEILFWKQVQFLFFLQWRALRDYAKKNQIRIVGDLPIYVSPDSADLWAAPSLFQVDADLNLIDVAGCPPDCFSPLGQLWGNPLYDWPKHKDEDFNWWVQRLQHAGQIYDLLRVDHFRGFESYYAIPADHTTAEFGVWRQGPGLPFIETIKERLPNLEIIAEDLGVITPEVRQILDASGFPGMRVLQFAFDSREGSEYLPYKYPFNTVVYTGTHDNTTTEDWQYSSPASAVQFAREYMDTDDPNELTWRFIRAAMSSSADTCIVPMQDFLRLGAEARLNTPGTRQGNWRWRVDGKMLTDDLAEQIRQTTELYGRRRMDIRS
ncbi:MAG: 4-alpha-glucanotransferase [Clostridiaceae bacterium]|nr:4-alpha-glucanotransferase [Clostridiaceae bacterium]